MGTGLALDAVLPITHMTLTPMNGPCPPAPPPEYAVDCILDEHRRPSGSLRYHVRWLAPNSPTTWEPSLNLEGCLALDRWLLRPGPDPLYTHTMRGDLARLDAVLLILS
jgi:hypothetical protein